MVVDVFLVLSAWRTFDEIAASVRVFFEREDLLLTDHHAAVAAVDRRAIEHDRVFDIVPRITHHGDHGVLACRELREVEKVQHARANHRHHRVHHHVQRGDVHSLLLVASDGADCLLAHSALIGVSRRLVVIGVGNQRGYDAQDRYWIDLHVRVRRRDVLVRHCDQTRVLLVHVDVLDHASAHQLLDRDRSASNSLRVRFGQERTARFPVENQQRPADAASIARQMHAAANPVVVHAHKRAEQSAATQLPHASHQRLRLRVHAEQASVEEDETRWTRVELLSAEEPDVENAEIVRDLTKRFFVLIDGDVREDGETFDQTALLAFRRVPGTHHAELGELQRARAADLLRLLDVRADSRHVSDGRDVRQSRDWLRPLERKESKKNLGDAFAIDVESLEDPVSGFDGVDAAVGDDVVELLHYGHHIERVHARRLFIHSLRQRYFLQRFVHELLHFRVVHLKQILEKQRHQIARRLDSLVSVVILIAQQRVIENALKTFARHVRQIHAFRPEIVANHRHMAQNRRVEDFAAFLFSGSFPTPSPFSHADEGSHPFQGLLLGEDAEFVSFFDALVEVRAVFRLVSDLDVSKCFVKRESTNAMIS